VSNTQKVSIERRNCHTCAYFYAPNTQVLLGAGIVKRHANATSDKALPGCFLAMNSQPVQLWIKQNVGGTDDWPRKHPCPVHVADCPGWSINAEASNAIIGLAVTLHDAINETFPRGAVPHMIDAANKKLRDVLWPKAEMPDEDEPKPKKKGRTP
jgi:hypothetical protein